MPITKDLVLTRLRKIIDPELGINLVDLGLIYKLQITSHHQQSPKIKIVMTLTNPGCPLASLFEALIKEALEDLPNFNSDTDLNIDLTFDPPWTPDMMTPAAKAQLGFD